MRKVVRASGVEKLRDEYRQRRDAGFPCGFPCGGPEDCMCAQPQNVKRRTVIRRVKRGKP